ncbi:hypothetical protein NFHkm12_15830 [Latilactobacillus curvatus]|nr:hypothetical protein NFHkm12_15830 [Latilactobacillus curvatus]
MLSKITKYFKRYKQIDYLISLLTSDKYSLNEATFDTFIRTKNFSFLINHYNMELTKYDGSNIDYRNYEIAYRSINNLNEYQRSILKLRILSIRHSEDLSSLLSDTIDTYYSLIPILFTILLSGIAAAYKLEFAGMMVNILIVCFVLYSLLSLLIKRAGNKYYLRYQLLESLFK